MSEIKTKWPVWPERPEPYHWEMYQRELAEAYNVPLLEETGMSDKRIKVDFQALQLAMAAPLDNRAEVAEIMFAEDVDATIEALQIQLAQSVRWSRLLAENADYLSARLDALMLEFCPERMTDEQMANWKRHQRTEAQNECGTHE